MVSQRQLTNVSIGVRFRGDLNALFTPSTSTTPWTPDLRELTLLRVPLVSLLGVTLTLALAGMPSSSSTSSWICRFLSLLVERGVGTARTYRLAMTVSSSFEGCLRFLSLTIQILFFENVGSSLP